MPAFELKSIIRDYYDTMTSAMQYEWSEDNRRLHEDVLRLILQVYGESDNFEACRKAVEDASAVCTVADTLLANAAGDVRGELDAAVFDAKARIIREKNITFLLPFDYDMLSLDTRTDGERGVKSACRLLAVMKWLDGEDSRGRTVAVEIWKTLAVSGDEFAIKALVFALEKMGDTASRDHWNSVCRLLDKARDSFSPFITDDGDCTPEAMGTASIIMLIRRISQGKKNAAILDRPMLHYALYSNDDFDKKLATLTSGEDFYALHFREQNKPRTKIGFLSADKSEAYHIA